LNNRTTTTTAAGARPAAIGSFGGPSLRLPLTLGFVQVAGSVFLPNIASLVPYILLMVVLLVAPRGIGRGRVLN